MTRYGHVPEANLGIYRYWAGLARDADRLGGTMSNIGHYQLANIAWQMEAILRARANTYRVVLPAEPGDVAAEPPTTGDVAVLVGEEDADAGEDRQVTADPGPEQVPSRAWIVQPENP